MTPTAQRRFLYAMIAALAGIVLSVLIAAIAQACDGTDPCGAEPAPLPVLYLPRVQRDMPGMSTELAPWVPVPTVTPDPTVTGDVTN